MQRSPTRVAFRLALHGTQRRDAALGFALLSPTYDSCWEPRNPRKIHKESPSLHEAAGTSIGSRGWQQPAGDVVAKPGIVGILSVRPWVPWVPWLLLFTSVRRNALRLLRPTMPMFVVHTGDAGGKEQCRRLG